MECKRYYSVVVDVCTRHQCHFARHWCSLDSLGREWNVALYDSDWGLCQFTISVLKLVADSSTPPSTFPGLSNYFFPPLSLVLISTRSWVQSPLSPLPTCGVPPPIFSLPIHPSCAWGHHVEVPDGFLGFMLLHIPCFRPKLDGRWRGQGAELVAFEIA